MSGHGVGQRGEVGGQGRVAIKGASSVNRFAYSRKRQRFPIAVLCCHVVDQFSHVERNNCGMMMMMEMKHSIYSLL